MSFVLLGILNSQAAAGGDYWIAEFNQNTLVGDTNYFVGGHVSGENTDDIYVAKYDNLGSLIWQYAYFGGLRERAGSDITAVSSDRVIFSTPNFSSSTDEGLVLIDSDGTVVFSKLIDYTNAVFANNILEDSSGNFYTALSGTQDTTNRAGVISKFNSSGVRQFAVGVEDGTNDTRVTGLGIDSSGNIYAGGADGDTKILNQKYDSSGTLVWQRSLDTGSTFVSNAATTSSSSGDNYTTSYASTPDTVNLIKRNSSGVLQWQKEITGASGLELEGGRGIVLDSNGDIYIAIKQRNTPTTGSPRDASVIMKFDSSGNVIWQRQLLTDSDDLFVQTIDLDENEDVLVGGGISMKVPNDGSAESTVDLDGNTYTYEASSLTVATSSFTDAATSFTTFTSSTTVSAYSLTQTSASVTSSVEPLG